LHRLYRKHNSIYRYQLYETNLRL